MPNDAVIVISRVLFRERLVHFVFDASIVANLVAHRESRRIRRPKAKRDFIINGYSSIQRTAGHRIVRRRQTVWGVRDASFNTPKVLVAS